MGYERMHATPPGNPIAFFVTLQIARWTGYRLRHYYWECFQHLPQTGMMKSRTAVMAKC